MTLMLGTNANNDIYLGADGNIVVLSGLQAVLGACATASKAQLGEMVLARNSGIPNFQAIWVGVPNYAIWEQYLRTTLLGVPGVVQVSSLTISKNGDVMNYTATIETEFGTGNING